jgi:hypothetical protein
MSDHQHLVGIEMEWLIAAVKGSWDEAGDRYFGVAMPAQSA